MNAYRLDDAAKIEIGDHSNTLRVEYLGQKKYVQIWLRQQEVLYCNKAYSQLQE